MQQPWCYHQQNQTKTTTKSFDSNHLLEAESTSAAVVVVKGVGWHDRVTVDIKRQATTPQLSDREIVGQSDVHLTDIARDSTF